MLIEYRNGVKKCKAKAVESSGWKWFETYSIELLKNTAEIHGKKNNIH